MARLVGSKTRFYFNQEQSILYAKGSDASTVYRVGFVQWKFLDGWRIFKIFQCKIKFGCKKLLQTFPVSENFPCQIFPVQMFAVDENFPMYGM